MLNLTSIRIRNWRATHLGGNMSSNWFTSLVKGNSIVETGVWQRNNRVSYYSGTILFNFHRFYHFKEIQDYCAS